MPNPLDPIFQAFTQLRATWPKRGWSWDSRFDCVASSFDVTLVDPARDAISRALPIIWTDKTLSGAAQSIRDVAERTGGVRAGQVVFSRDAILGVQPYGLWWPWGDGMTISLRVGLDSRYDYSAELCKIFGAER